MSFSNLVEALDRTPCGTGYKAFCPAHRDNNRSLSLTERNGRVLVHCFAGCSQQEVISALRYFGLWPNSNEKQRRAL